MEKDIDKKRKKEREEERKKERKEGNKIVDINRTHVGPENDEGAFGEGEVLQCTQESPTKSLKGEKVDISC